MLNIGICDSNPVHREQLHRMLASILFDATDIRVTHYPNGREFLTELEKGQCRLDLLFLEIALPDMNGLKIASAIRLAAHKCDIIFLTELERYVYDGYLYHAYDYLLKPVTAKKIGGCVRRYISEKFKNQESYLTVSIKGNTERINLWDILYFESRQRKIAAIMEDREIEFYQKMGDLFAKIERAGFVRVHQSYVVNAGRIAALHSHELVLCEGSVVPVSKRYAADIKHLLQQDVSQGE